MSPRRVGSLRLCLPGLLYAGGVAAAQNQNRKGPSLMDGMASADCPSDLTVQDQQSYNTLQSCADAYSNSYPGSVTFLSYTPATVPGQEPTIDLGRVKGIGGSLTFSNISAQEFSILGSEVDHIQGGLIFENLDGFTLNNPWSNVYDMPSVTFKNVNFAGNTTFNLGYFFPLNSGGNLALTFNGTNIQEVEGYSNEAQSRESEVDAKFTNNAQLTLLSLAYIVDCSLTVANNNEQLSITLPNLMDGETLNISDANAFTADQMYRANSVSFTSSNLETLSLPSLHYIGETLYIANNSLLDTLSIPNLEALSALKILDNPNLKDINFPNLRSVKAFDVTGPINNLSSPALNQSGTNVDINVLSKGTFVCPTDFSKLPQHTCTNSNGAAAPPSSTSSASPGATTTSSGSSSGSAGGSGLSSGAKIGIGVGVGVGVALLLAAFAACIIARRRRRRGSNDMATPSEYSKDQLDGAQSPSGYKKVPATTHAEAGARRRSNRHNEGEEWHELEEQQRERHEMDARSITNVDREEDSPSRRIVDHDDDDEEDRRSLDDIERIHAQG